MGILAFAEGQAEADAALLEAPRTVRDASLAEVVERPEGDEQPRRRGSVVEQASRRVWGLVTFASLLGLALVCFLVAWNGGLLSNVPAHVEVFDLLGRSSSNTTCPKPFVDDCRNTSCCGEFTTCYEKDETFATCRPTCTLGVPDSAPPWDPHADMIPWTCKVLGKKQAVPTWKPSTGSPSLYCFLVTLVRGNEPELLRWQLAKGVGIFGCNAYSVFSERRMLLGPAPSGSMLSTTAIGGPMSSSINNTYDFLRAWHKVVDQGEFHKHAWTLKVDPDTVLLPSRLRPKLASHQISMDVDKMYFRNCRTYKSVQGPLELFTRAAAEAFFGSLKFCQSQSYIMKHGEDWFFGHCMEALGVHGVEDYSLLDDQWCTGKHPKCSADMAAWHPFKVVEGYMKCVDDAS